MLEEQALPSGLLDVPELPGIVDEERIVADTDTLGFLRRMKAVGGLTPREGYAPLPPGSFAAPSAPRKEPCRPHHLAHRLWAVGGEPVEPLDQPGIGAGKLFVGDAIRRHQIDGRAERPDVEAASRGTRTSAPGSAPTGSFGLALQVEGEDRAEQPRPHHIFAAGSSPSMARCRASIREMRPSVSSSANSIRERSATAQASGLAVKE